MRQASLYPQLTSVVLVILLLLFHAHTYIVLRDIISSINNNLVQMNTIWQLACMPFHIVMAICMLVTASVTGTEYPHQTNGGDDEYERP